jgi:hypothetical protein
VSSVDIKLFGKQVDIFNDWVNTDKHSICIVPAGSGKTFLASIFLPIAASDVRYHKDKDILYLAPTREMIKTLIWPSLVKSCKEYFNLNDEHINNGDLTIKFPNGIFLRCKSAEQRENLRGINAGIAIMDEASLYNEEALQEITNRLRPKVGSADTPGRMIIISTPYGAGPLFELYKAALANPDKFSVRHYDWKQMRSGSVEFIKEQQKILSPMKFAQDYLCSFEQVSDMFYYTFKPQFHTTAVEDTGGELYHFADFNKRIATSIIARVNKPHTQEGTIEVLKAYTIDNCGTEQLAQAIRADWPRRRIWSVIDMSGTHVNRDTTSPFGITDRILLEKYGFVIMNTNKSNPLVSDTDNTCNAFIAQDRLKVDHLQTKLIEALKTYHYEDGTRKKLVKYSDKFAYIDGLGDCLRYGIHHLFPIQHSNKGIPNYQTMDQRFHHRPGVEHMPVSPVYPGGPTWEELLKGDDVADYQTY